MERPISAASSGTSNPPTQQHRRHASSIKNSLRPAGSSTVSLFVTNLRLLDLDLYPDWPNITVLSFSNQDARTRIKSTEYALYQLFRLYDPATTSEKLQVFFPPLEPLQSVNLRAGLFRCLNELKKGGVLAKDTVLRKTMLDDCQGDKFWEVCLGFSAVVLRKRMAEKNRRSKSRQVGGPGVAEKIGTAQGVSRSQRESMLRLAIAHRAALGKVLEKKQEKKQVYGRLYDLLAGKEDELVQRKARAQELAQGSKAIEPRRLRAVEETVEKNWIGSTDLRDALIDGDTCPKGDGLLVKSFDHLWNEDGDAGHHDSGGAEVGLLQSLNEKTTEQSARLRKWQHFHDRLMASKPQSARSSRPASLAQKTGLTFNKHRDVNLSEVPENNDRTRQQQKARPHHDNVTRYDDILTAMREELRKNSTAHRTRPAASPIQQSFNMPKRAQTQPLAPVRKFSVTIDTSAGAQSHHMRSPSGTTVPLRSPMGRRVASRSRSYDRPKTDGQREPIPLKAELFSPLKGSRRSSLSPLSANSVLAAPEEVPEADEEDTESAESSGAVESASQPSDVDGKLKSPASPRDSGLGLKADVAVRNVAFAPDSDTTESTSSSDVESAAPVQPIERANGTLSLAERTRKSMAFTSGDSANNTPSKPQPDIPELSDTSDDDDQDHTAPLNPIDDHAFDRRTSLLDRTRQSISLAPKAKKLTHHRSRTSTYPINQFETPKKARRSTIGRDESGARRDLTPMEELMSPEAQYDSVFKSRPKIAASPVLSPCLEGEGLDMQLGVGAEERTGEE